VLSTESVDARKFWREKLKLYDVNKTTGNCSYKILKKFPVSACVAKFCHPPHIALLVI
jgi:hypothetical protein